MTSRILRIELRRGVAPWAFLVVAVTGVAILADEVTSWAGRWAALAEYGRTATIVLVPIGLAAGAWQGGRERRRRMDDLLASAARPPWITATARWASVAAGACAGFVVMFVVGAVLVGQVATYSGGGWWWQVLVGVVAEAAAVAVGFGIGRSMPWRVIAPVAGVACYVAVAVSVDGDSRTQWLSPALGYLPTGVYLPAWLHALQATWFVLLAAAALTVVGARRRHVVIAPATLAVATATVLATVPGDTPWQTDPRATELVCRDASPWEVCTPREDAFLLDDLTSVAGDTLTRLEGFDGLRTRIVGSQAWNVRRDDDASVDLRPYTSWSGDLLSRGHDGGRLGNDLIYNVLPTAWACSPTSTDARTIHTASDIAAAWAGASYPRSGMYVTLGSGAVHVSQPEWGGGAPQQVPTAEFTELTSWPATRQQDWLRRYIPAARACDADALAALTKQLR